MMSALPDGWAEARVGELFQCWGGMTPSTGVEAYWGGSTPWVSSKDVRGIRIDGGTETVTAKALAETRLRRCRPGTVVLVVRSGVLAHSLPVAVTTREVVVNQDIKALDSGCDQLNEWLAFYLLACEREILQATRKEGTTVQSIRVKELLQRRVPVAPLAEQGRIVTRVEALLDQVDSIRDRLAKGQMILKRFRQAVVGAACSGRLTENWRRAHPNTRARVEEATPEELESVHRLPDCPDEWVMTTVGSIAERIQYGTSVKAHDTGSGVPILRMGNIQEGHLDLTELKYVTSAEGQEAFFVREGDILFNRTNSPELVGKAAVANGAARMLFASYLIRVRVDPKVALPEYVCSWINSPWGREWARVVRTDGVSQSNINSSKLAAMLIPLPSLGEQQEIVRQLRMILNSAGAIDGRVLTAVKRVEGAVQALLSKAFSGALVPTEAEVARAEEREYEPAASLLERIRRERELPAPPKRAGRPAAVARGGARHSVGGRLAHRAPGAQAPTDS